MKKLLLLFHIFGSSIFGSLEMDEEGWVTIAKPSQENISNLPGEENSSFGVVFSKQIGSEKILVRFPDEPSYLYKEGGEMDIFSLSKEGECRVQILKRSFETPQELLDSRQNSLRDAVITNALAVNSSTVELIYWKDGFWHFERWISTPEHTYFFHTKTASRDLAFHRDFAQSFDLEIIPS